MQLVGSYAKTDEKQLAKMALNKQPMDIDPAGIDKIAALMRDNDMLKTNSDLTPKIFK